MTKYNTSKKSDVEIYKLNIEDQRLLASQYQIKGIPTMVYLKNGEIVAKKLGVKSVEQLKDYEKNYFSK